MNLADVDEAVAVSPWHLVVDLSYNIFRAFCRGQRGVYTNAKTAKPMRVGRRNLDQRNVQRHGAALKQLLHFAQVYRRVIGAAIVDRFANISADENGVVPEMAFHFRLDVIRVAERKQVNHFHVPDKRGALQERFHQGFGLGTAWLNVNPHPGPDRFESLLRGLLLFCILASPVHTEPFSKRLTASVSWPRTAGGTRRIRDGRWPAPASLP